MSRAADMLSSQMMRYGMSQTQLARDTGLSRTYINDILRGRTPVSARAALAFELLLGVSAHALLTEQNKDNLEKARR